MFQLQANQTNIKTECLAGLTTFSTMSYIIFLNPQILQQTGMDFGAVMAATILASSLATLGMGLLANFPFALAPGMALNAFFTYGMVMGSGFSWQTALGICFLGALLLLLLTVLGIRQKVMHAIPPSLRAATTGGIGLFLAFIGLKNVGLVEAHSQTIITLGNLARPEVILAALGVIVTAALLSRKIPGAIFLGILMNWMLGLLFGLVKWNGIVALPPSLEPTFLKLDLLSALQPAAIPLLISLVFVAMLDSAGTLLGLADQARLLDQKGQLPRANRALFNDSLGSIGGAIFGTSPVSIYLESSAGISAGGRTGLTAVFVAAFFLLALFFTPFASSIPYFATSPILIITGALLLKPLRKLNWQEPAEFIPAFIILLAIPLTFSISTGIALGFITYPLIQLLAGRVREVHWMVWLLALLFGLKFAYL